MNKIQKITHRLTLESGVEIMFIVKNKDILYCNQYTDTFFELDEDNNLILKGRVVKIVFKSLFNKIEIFVAFNETESYTLFTAKIDRDKRLHYVASEVINYIDKNKISKQLKFNLSTYFTCYSAYKLYKKDNKYFMVNNRRSDAYIITENSYKNSNNVSPLIEEFFDNQINNSTNNIEVDIVKKFKKIIQYIETYGLGQISCVYALMINEFFHREIMSIRLSQMLQFLREEADAASYSDLPKIRNLGLEIFKDEKIYKGAMTEKALFPIDNAGGPQQTLLLLLMPIAQINMPLSADLRIAIVKHIAHLFNIFKSIVNEYKVNTYRECNDLIYKYDPTTYELMIKGHKILEYMIQDEIFS